MCGQLDHGALGESLATMRSAPCVEHFGVLLQIVDSDATHRALAIDGILNAGIRKVGWLAVLWLARLRLRFKAFLPTLLSRRRLAKLARLIGLESFDLDNGMELLSAGRMPDPVLLCTCPTALALNFGHGPAFADIRCRCAFFNTHRLVLR